jgi:hypothetical protein
VNGLQSKCGSVEALPKEPFRVVVVDVGRSPKVTDDALAVFAGCKHVAQLNLFLTATSGKGLRHFAACTGLREVNIERTHLDDAALKAFGNCKELKKFSVSYCPGVGDLGLSYVAGAKGLIHLDVTTTQVTDRGLAQFAGCRNLARLEASHTTITDAAFASFKDQTAFEVLILDGLPLTDTALAPFAAYKKVQVLSLRATTITDTGLAHLRDLPNLTALDVRQTKVTAEGAAGLAKVLPKCKIVWDGGTIEPKSAEPRVEALLPPKARLLFEEKFRNVKDGNLVGQGLWTGEYVRVKNGMINLQEPPPKNDPITRELAHFLYARRKVEGAPDAVEFIVGFEALAYSISDKSKFKANNTTIIARRRSDVYIGWSQETSGEQPEWIFDARKRDADYGKVAPHNSPNCVIVPGGHDHWVALTIHFDLKAKEVYGSYDFGDGVKRTKRISVKDRNIDTLEMVEIATDFRVNRRGMLIKSIAAWAVEK